MSCTISSYQNNSSKEFQRNRYCSEGDDEDDCNFFGQRTTKSPYQNSFTPCLSEATFNSRTFNEPVSFTIGDSSDSESVSTTTSDFIGQLPTPRNFPILLGNQRLASSFQDDSFCCNDKQWHKFHFHYENEPDENRSGIPNNDHKRDHRSRRDDRRPRINGDREVNTHTLDGRDGSYGSSLHTTRIIPNDDFSLSRLRDVNSDDETDGGSSCGTKSCFRNCSKWRILVSCLIVQFFSALIISLQAPYFPAEAEKKGVHATAYGFVFGVFELTVFFFAPFYGSRIHNWNSKLVFNIGIFVTAISSIIFGLLDRIENRIIFTAACCVVRSVEAMGEAAVITASFIIVASAFPDSVASTFAILEAFYSMGLLAGPFVGSLLYQIGGYSLPFIAVGGSLLAAALMNCFILPSSKEISAFHTSPEPIIISSYKSFRLLRIVGVAVSAFCIVVGSMSISFLQATLEPHMRQFQISQMTVGAMLIIGLGVYTLSAPFWGLICDKMLQLKLVTFCGAAILISGFALVGPLPFLQLEPKLWLVAVGLVLQGIGLGAVLVSSFVSILRNVIVSAGLPDNPSTYGLVSSLWTSMFSLGSFIGPSLSGILYDAVGFPWASMAIIICSAFMMLFVFIFVCSTDNEMHSFRSDDENEPLLTNASASTYSSGPTNHYT